MLSESSVAKSRTNEKLESVFVCMVFVNNDGDFKHFICSKLSAEHPKDS